MNDIPNYPMDKQLRALLDAAKTHVMTPKEAYDQRVSWIWGNLPDESTITVEQIKEQLVRQGIVEPIQVEMCEGSKAYQVADMMGKPLYVPVCAEDAQEWFTNRLNLKGGMGCNCIVCAFKP